jgi:hypothetical protein
MPYVKPWRQPQMIPTAGRQCNSSSLLVTSCSDWHLNLLPSTKFWRPTKSLGPMLSWMGHMFSFMGPTLPGNMSVHITPYHLCTTQGACLHGGLYRLNLFEVLLRTILGWSWMLHGMHFRALSTLHARWLRVQAAMWEWFAQILVPPSVLMTGSRTGTAGPAVMVTVTVMMLIS